MNSFPKFRLRGLCLYSVLAFVCVAGAETLRPDVVFAWHDLLLQAAANSTVPIPPQIETRIFTMTHVAMDDAVVAVTRRGDEETSRLAAQRAAAASAAHTTLVRMMPLGAAVFDSLADRQLSAIADGPAKERGIRAGRAAADRIVALRESDRWVDVSLFNSESGREHIEAVTARVARGQQLPESPWLQARPFVMKSAGQFSVREVRSFNRNGTHFVDFELTNASLLKRVDQPAAIARAGTTWVERPLLTWNRFARQMCDGWTNDLAQQARLLAVLNVAIADATLGSLHWRWTVGNWRVVMMERWHPANDSPPRPMDILAYVDDRGPELVRAESQQVLVPPTQHYPSLAATVAGAAHAALEGFFRTDRLDFGTSSGSPAGQPVQSTFTSIAAAARESVYVASLNGPHTRESCVAGYFLGKAIGGNVTKQFTSGRSVR